jgi:hypothetical protein
MTRSAKQREELKARQNKALTKSTRRRGTPQTARASTSKEGGIDLGKIAIVFFIYGVIGLITSAFYSGGSTPFIRKNIVSMAGETLGPINIKKQNTVIEVSVAAAMHKNTWSFVEGELLDSKKEYLFSFGKELWRETGYDEGHWDEKDAEYSMDITIADPGTYYIKIKVKDGAKSPSSITVALSTKNGSNIPHLWFGIFALLIAIILNEKKNRSIRTILESAGDN